MNIRNVAYNCLPFRLVNKPRFHNRPRYANNYARYKFITDYIVIKHLSSS